jgi:cell wall-associated NlpC family hydrolase
MMKSRITRNVLTIVIAIALVIPTLLIAVPQTEAATTIGQAAAAKALALVGYPYKANGTLPSGFGYAGLSEYVYARYGVTIPNSVASQAALGVHVAKASLIPGDLVFFRSPGTSAPMLVGVYVGSGYFVASTPSRNGVAKRSLNESYYETYYYGARRLNSESKAVTMTISLKRLTVVATAKKYLGRPYVFGSSNAPYSFDCSSFVQYVMRLNGISMYRTAASQWYQGKAVSKANLRPGDIVFFTNTYKPGISHVGIYIGGGNIVDAFPNKGVRIVSLSNTYLAQHYAGARNVFGD